MLESVENEERNCNRPSPLLLDVVLFGFSFSSFPLKNFKTCILGRDFHTLINNVSFLGSHNPPSFGVQCLR